MNQKFSRRRLLAGLSVGTTLASFPPMGLFQSPVEESTRLDFETQPEGAFPLFISSGRPLAMFSHGDSVPVPVVFDTGTSGNMLDTKVFETFELELNPNVKSYTTDASGTTIENISALIKQGKIGGLPVKKCGIQVYDYRLDNEVGILGPELFRGSSVYLNLPNQTVYVRKDSPKTLDASDVTPYQLDNGSGLPVIDVSVEGMKKGGRALLDTGKDGAISFPEEMMDRIPLIGKPRQVGVVTTVFSSTPVLGGKMDADVTVGGHKISNPDVIFHGHVPKVGMPFLSPQRIWLEPANQRSWVATPTMLGVKEQSPFVGRFGNRKIQTGKDGLVYTNEGALKRNLICMGGDHFLFEDGKTDLIFRRDAAREITGFTLLAADGSTLEVRR